MKSVFPTSEPPLLKVTGRNYGYPVRRIFCVGRNYVEHVLELGNEVEKTQPFYFTKSSSLKTTPKQSLKDMDILFLFLSFFL